MFNYNNKSSKKQLPDFTGKVFKIWSGQVLVALQTPVK